MSLSKKKYVVPLCSGALTLGKLASLKKRRKGWRRTKKINMNTYHTVRPTESALVEEKASKVLKVRDRSRAQLKVKGEVALRLQASRRKLRRSARCPSQKGE